MTSLLVVYASRDRRTGKIANRIVVEARRLAEHFAAALALEALTLAGLVRYPGRYFPERWIMGRIFAAEGSAADTGRDREYTDRHQGPDFASRICTRPGPSPAGAVK